MIKSALTALAATPLMAGAALAGPYVNVEANSSFTGSDYTGTTTDAHVGYAGEAGSVGAVPENDCRWRYVDSSHGLAQGLEHLYGYLDVLHSLGMQCSSHGCGDILSFHHILNTMASLSAFGILAH